MSKNRKIGFVLGKFMPLHKGHKLLIDFANQFVDTLYVVVDDFLEENYKGEYIKISIRIDWLKKEFPDVIVLGINKPTPQEPNQHPDFRNFWKQTILDILPEHPNYMIASMAYGYRLSKELGIEFIPLDLEKELLNISATDIRGNLATYYKYIADSVKPHFTLKICVFGPESTGKTTLSKKLAQHFNTSYVPEYARFFLESEIKNDKNFSLDIGQLYNIGIGQWALEDVIIKESNKILICDTNILLTKIRSKWLFNGKCDERLLNFSYKNDYDLYLLLYPDTPWEKDDIRYFPDTNERKRFFMDCENELKDIGANYHVIQGNYEDRLEKSIEIINTLILTHFNYQYFVKKLENN